MLHIWWSLVGPGHGAAEGSAVKQWRTLDLTPPSQLRVQMDQSDHSDQLPVVEADVVRANNVA